MQYHYDRASRTVYRYIIESQKWIAVERVVVYSPRVQVAVGVALVLVTGAVFVMWLYRFLGEDFGFYVASWLTGAGFVTLFLVLYVGRQTLDSRVARIIERDQASGGHHVDD